MASHGYRAILIGGLFAGSLTALIGCASRDDDNLVPKTGFNYSKVSYDPKPIVNPTVIAVPLIHLEKYPNHRVTVALPSTIRPGAGLAFEGSLTFAQPRHRGGIVYVQFLQPAADNQERSTAAAFLPLKVTGDDVKFKVEIHAPKLKGRHKVSLRMLHPPSAEGLIEVASGEVEVR